MFVEMYTQVRPRKHAVEGTTNTEGVSHNLNRQTLLCKLGTVLQLNTQTNGDRNWFSFSAKNFKMKLLLVTTCVLLFALVVAENKSRGTPLISVLRKVCCHAIQLIDMCCSLSRPMKKSRAILNRTACGRCVCA
jgi:hypothetical protein